MTNVCVRLKTRSQNKYRKITSTAEAIYSTEDIRIETATPYVPGVALEEGEWFFIDQVSNQPYGKELVPANCTSVDYEILSQGEFDSISNQSVNNVLINLLRRNTISPEFMYPQSTG